MKNVACEMNLKDDFIALLLASSNEHFAWGIIQSLAKNTGATTNDNYPLWHENSIMRRVILRASEAHSSSVHLEIVLIFF